MATAAPTALQNLGVLANFIAGDTAWDVAMEKNFRMLDAMVQPRVLDKDLATPPGTPAAGDTYIVAAAATGLWSGMANKIARYSGSAWEFFTAKSGWRVYMVDEAVTYQYSGTAWASAAATVYSTHYAFLEVYAASAKVMQPQVVTRPTTFPANFAGSLAKCITGPAANNYLEIRKNGVVVGYLYFSPGSTNATPSGAGGTPVVFAVGDILTVAAQATADASFAGISVSLLGTL